MEELKGEITDIIFQNDLNGYTIAYLKTEDEGITIVGYLPFVGLYDTLKVIGHYVEHKDYGMQFKVETFEKLLPESLEALEKYLASGNIKGVGKAIAKRIVKNFKEETIYVLKNEPAKLANLKGISMDKAEEISQSFIENWEVWQIVGFLSKFGIGAEHAKKIFQVLGTGAIEKIESNPYVLVDFVRGVDFKQIDKMAMDLGLDSENDERVKSAIKYALLSIAYNGHTCAVKENLVKFVIDLLGVNDDIIENNIINLKVKDEIVIEKRDDDTEWIYLYMYYVAEKEIAKRISSLQKSKNFKKIHDLDKELKRLEKNSDIELSEKQIEAIKAVNDNNVCIITGGPGTGKTTIIKSIIDIYQNHGKRVVLCAPTGRAAKKMTETTGEEACTLHRLLEIGKTDEDYIYGKKQREYEGMPIDADVIVIDEVSMVDVFLMYYLSKSVFQGTKLILVGDSDQLPSVGPGRVLKDFIDSEKIVTVHLDKIFRQAAKSKIIVNAHRVNSGKRFINKNDTEYELDSKEDFFFVRETNQEKALNEVISLCTGRLKNYGNYDFLSSIQVITPTKKGILGTKELNKSLQDALNPHIEGENEKSNLGSTFRKGDRIMQIKNNYDIAWKKVGEGIGSGIFNGELGIIENIDDTEKQVRIRFDDDKIAWYNYSELDQIEHSYAITIHKAQGSEFPVVILILPRSAPMLLTRNLLYTGITRAKEMLIVISNENIVDYMINNVNDKKRNTGLEFKLRNLL